MNKRVNTVLFILAATVLNIVVMTVLFAVLLVFFARFVAPALSPGVNQIILLLIFVVSVVLTYFLYHRFMRWLTTKYSLDEYMSPLFGKKK
ncbi:MAG: hypothetical protein WCY01_04245 [Alkalispirochaeta sp.]|jgi:membrane protein implicated in regulation of membrane protease activity